MDREEIIITTFSCLGLILIPLICYYFAIKITAKKHYKRLKKIFLQILLASIICFLFCLVYTLVGGSLAFVFDFNVHLLGVRIFDGLSVILFPISIISIIVFAFCFFLAKNKEPGHRNQDVAEKV